MPSASSFYYHTDHQGSVRALTSDGGQVVNSYAYDSYGTALESVESLAQRFRYTGREFDALTGLYHYRARAYDPETARFLQEDPLGFDAGDLNVYRYVGSNPMNWTDPSGMSAIEDTALYGMATAALLGGVIATKAMLDSGKSTASYLAIDANDRNSLSSTSGTIACRFFTLADSVGAAGVLRIVGIDETVCGVETRIPDDDDDFVIPAFLLNPAPITIPNASDCQKHLNLCLIRATPTPGNVFGTSNCLTCYDVCKNVGIWPYSVPTGSCLYPGFVDD